MKKTFKLVAIALTATALMAACKGAPETTEEPIDTIEAIEEVVEDTTPAVDTTVATPAPEAQATTKKAAKKAEPKSETKELPGKDGKSFTIAVGDVKAEVNAEEVKVQPLKRK